MAEIELTDPLKCLFFFFFFFEISFLVNVRNQPRRFLHALNASAKGVLPISLLFRYQSCGRTQIVLFRGVIYAKIKDRHNSKVIFCTIHITTFDFPADSEGADKGYLQIPSLFRYLACDILQYDEQ